MPVVASAYALEAHAQVDGRVWVTETHTLSAGAPVLHTYLADPQANHQAIMEARVAAIDAQLAEAEADAVIGAD